MKTTFREIVRPLFLKRVARPLLAGFLKRFESELAQAGLAIPPPDLSEPDWLTSLQRCFGCPEKLPGALTEALFAMQQISSPEARDQLEAAVTEAGLLEKVEPGSTAEDLALQVWLADPRLLARKSNQLRLRRLTAFEYFGCKATPAERPPVVEPGSAVLSSLVELLDPWFAANHRGRDTAIIELYPIRHEYWFLIRHGDTFVRAPSVQARRTDVLHYRPERDDVVVYSPAHEEIRVYCRTRGERDLYRRAFGKCLRGDEDWFSVSRTYTLEPLRTLGADALDPAGLEGVNRIILREVQVQHEDSTASAITVEAADVFQGTWPGDSAPLPRHGRLARAVFDVHFTGCPRPRPVQIRPPNILRVAHHCDGPRLQDWLCRAGFRANG